jgi:hypothetical protein
VFVSICKRQVPTGNRSVRKLKGVRVYVCVTLKGVRMYVCDIKQHVFRCEI